MEKSGCLGIGQVEGAEKKTAGSGFCDLGGPLVVLRVCDSPPTLSFWRTMWSMSSVRVAWSSGPRGGCSSTPPTDESSPPWDSRGIHRVRAVLSVEAAGAVYRCGRRVSRDYGPSSPMRELPRETPWASYVFVPAALWWQRSEAILASAPFAFASRHR